MRTPETEPQPENKIYHYPLSTRQAELLQAGDILKHIPLEKIFRVLFSRIPNQTFADKNAYGEFGGDLIQHGNKRAISLAIQGEVVDATIQKISTDRATIQIHITLPNFGNKDLWPGGKLERTITLPINEILGPLAKLFKKTRLPH